jgi:hypothetical protein
MTKERDQEWYHSNRSDFAYNHRGFLITKIGFERLA